MNWYDKVSKDISHIPDAVAHYEAELLEAKLECKIYGNIEESADEYLAAFERGGNMGILLNGEKGSGKTLLSKIICIKSKLYGNRYY